MSCYKKSHRYYIKAKCNACGRVITYEFTYPCHSSVLHRINLRRIGCIKCRNENDFAVLFFFCRRGMSDCFNMTSSNEFKNVGFSAFIKNIDP